jgi:hypothetical protein
MEVFMSAALEEIVSKFQLLSVQELMEAQEEIIHVLRNKIQEKNTATVNVAQRQSIFSQETLEMLAEIFTPEEIIEIEETDISNLPPLTVSLTDIISEGREDRF